MALNDERSSVVDHLSLRELEREETRDLRRALSDADLRMSRMAALIECYKDSHNKGYLFHLVDGQCSCECCKTARLMGCSGGRGLEAPGAAPSSEAIDKAYLACRAIRNLTFTPDTQTTMGARQFHQIGQAAAELAIEAIDEMKKCGLK